MGRPQQPVRTTNRALAQLTKWLREQKERTGLNYRQLAQQAGCHATTLQRAASGKTVPKLPTVLAYARVCGAPADHAEELWRRARKEDYRSARRGIPPAPRLELIRDLPDFSAALVELYEKAGVPSQRVMARQAGAYGVLPRSTVERIIKRHTVPSTEAQLLAYLRACQVPEREHARWVATWSRVHGRKAEQSGSQAPPSRLENVLISAVAHQAYTRAPGLADLHARHGGQMVRCPSCMQGVSVRRKRDLAFTECLSCGVLAVRWPRLQAQACLTIREAADLLDQSTPKVLDLVLTGTLQAIRVERLLRIPLNELADHLEGERGVAPVVV
ncbi:DNA binding domain-containing protein, excisionase family [Streptomyces sp. SceaMP-e96]|uniref:helix-turn-helix domain-containing protein n=1 Tax=Streptomyces TaxID=1883 RepID=UPI0008237980|nr:MULTISPECIES: helix-turn-helix domain-containing protein [unclassified Streptomyces]MYT17471.1 helix-turn-helix domain-containing protein [Streptomyces sp. SID4951]SCK42415.1 DNA binding domain-containing protein, excisionase family [Streptomyces sp. SceaMP-e96]